MNGWWWWRWMVTGPASPFLPGWQLSTTTSPTCCSSTQPNPPQPRLPLSPRRRLSISSIFSAGDISPNQKMYTNSRAMFCCQQPISTPSAPTFSPAPLCFLETLFRFSALYNLSAEDLLFFYSASIFFRILPCFRFLSLDPGAGRRIFSSPSSLQTKAPFPVLIIS